MQVWRDYRLIECETTMMSLKPTALREVAVFNTEDVAPVVHAHWILHDDNKDIWDCSNCKIHVFVNVLLCKGNYCPNCGAKMDEEV